MPLHPYTQSLQSGKRLFWPSPNSLCPLKGRYPPFSVGTATRVAHPGSLRGRIPTEVQGAGDLCSIWLVTPLSLPRLPQPVPGSTGSGS